MEKIKISNAFSVVPEVVVRLSRGSYVGTEGSLVGPLFVAVTFRALEALGTWCIFHHVPGSRDAKADSIACLCYLGEAIIIISIV